MWFKYGNSAQHNMVKVLVCRYYSSHDKLTITKMAMTTACELCSDNIHIAFAWYLHWGDLFEHATAACKNGCKVSPEALLKWLPARYSLHLLRESANRRTWRGDTTCSCPEAWKAREAFDPMRWDIIFLQFILGRSSSGQLHTCVSALVNFQ